MSAKNKEISRRTKDKMNNVMKNKDCNLNFSSSSEYSITKNKTIIDSYIASKKSKDNNKTFPQERYFKKTLIAQRKDSNSSSQNEQDSSITFNTYSNLENHSFHETIYSKGQIQQRPSIQYKEDKKKIDSILKKNDNSISKNFAAPETKFVYKIQIKISSNRKKIPFLSKDKKKGIPINKSLLNSKLSQNKSQNIQESNTTDRNNSQIKVLNEGNPIKNVDNQNIISEFRNTLMVLNNVSQVMMMNNQNMEKLNKNMTKMNQNFESFIKTQDDFNKGILNIIKNKV